MVVESETSRPSVARDYRDARRIFLRQFLGGVGQVEPEMVNRVVTNQERLEDAEPDSGDEPRWTITARGRAARAWARPPIVA